MPSLSRNLIARRVSIRLSSICALGLVELVGRLLLIASCAALGSAPVAAYDQPLYLSTGDISVLYGSWEAMIGSSDTPIVMRVGAKTITVGGCPTAYRVLDVKTIGKFYFVEVKESKSATLGVPAKGMPGCLSNGSPFVAERVLSSMPHGSLPPITEFACQSYKDLRAIEVNPMADVHCGLGGLSWSPLRPREQP